MIIFYTLNSPIYMYFYFFNANITALLLITPLNFCDNLEIT